VWSMVSLLTRMGNGCSAASSTEQALVHGAGSLV
jgi:hypothetical protein